MYHDSALTGAYSVFVPGVFLVLTGRNVATEPERTLMVHPLNTGRFGDTGDPILSRHALSTAFAPNKRMPMRVPVRTGLYDSLLDSFPRQKLSPFESQRLQDLPPQLDEVQVGCVLGLEDKLPARMSQIEEQDVILLGVLSSYDFSS
jgi:hypothetical protein